MAVNTTGNPTVWFGHNLSLPKYTDDQLRALLRFKS
jgi:hypothetical protein